MFNRLDFYDFKTLHFQILNVEKFKQRKRINSKIKQAYNKTKQKIYSFSRKTSNQTAFVKHFQL